LRLHLVGSLIGREEETVSLPFAPRWRCVVGVAICTALLAACGSDSDESDTATPPTRPSISFPSTLSTSPPIVTDNDPAKAAPRWEQVRVVTGNAPMDLGAIKIASGAIQWRVKWDCEAGAMRITTTPPAVPTRPGPLVDSRCPGSGEGFGRQTGDVGSAPVGEGRADSELLPGGARGQHPAGRLHGQLAHFRLGAG
jgi:hypothetical protein